MCCHYGCRHAGCGCRDDYDAPYSWGPGPGWGYGRGRRYYEGPPTRDEAAEDIEDYKASLEAEIRRLEKRIGSLRQKSTTE